MLNGFIQCPFCAGHEKISPQTVEIIESLISHYLEYRPSDHPDASKPTEIELHNIRNDILNRQERIDPLLR